MGGAVACFGDKTVCSFEQVEFSENNAFCCGGALKLGDDSLKQDVTTKLKDCQFSHNTVGNKDAMLYCGDRSPSTYVGADICGYDTTNSYGGVSDTGSTFNILSFQSSSIYRAASSLANGIPFETKRNPMHFKTCADLQTSESGWVCPEGTKCEDVFQLCSPAGDSQRVSGPGFCPAMLPRWAAGSVSSCECSLYGKFGPTCITPTPAPTSVPTKSPTSPPGPTPKPPPTPSPPTPPPTPSPTFVTCSQLKIDSMNACKAACKGGSVTSASCGITNGVGTCTDCECNGMTKCKEATPSSGKGDDSDKKSGGAGGTVAAIVVIVLLVGCGILLYMNRDQVLSRLGMGESASGSGYKAYSDLAEPLALSSTELGGVAR